MAAIKAAITMLLLVAMSKCANVCPAKCSDCSLVDGVAVCKGCIRATLTQAGDCTGPQITNCVEAKADGKCAQCEIGFALDTVNNNCNTKRTIDNCVLEYVGANGNKCAICSGGFPSDDQTSCKTGDPSSVCQWGGLLGMCAKCKYENLMAAYSGECVGRYVWGCLAENGEGRCNGCDFDRLFYMKFPNSCWRD